MKRQTKAIIKAVSALLAMAVTSGGYLLLSFVASVLIVSPLWFLITRILLNIMFVVYNIMPVSNRLSDWINDHINTAYMWYKYRPRTSGDQTIYQAIIIN